MIINCDDVLINIVLDDIEYFNLNFNDIENLLGKYKNEYNDLAPKEIRSIPNCYAYFVGDNDNNEFTCKIYKTSFDTDRWIMLMSDDFEGYALYENPESHEKQLAWYHTKLEKPLNENEEEKMRTCYTPPRRKN